MKNLLICTVGLALAANLSLAQAQPHEEILAALASMAPGSPAPAEGQFVHIPPTLEDLEASNLNPELKKVIRRGYDLFTNTQQVRERYSLNDMNCDSCHMGAGRLPFSSPVWPAAVILPNYRPKNDQVNNIEERIAGCFSYSMNGEPPAYGSDDMLALTAYHQ